jgi:hypothetical protein
MAETRSAAVDQTVPDDLIIFLKAIPDGRFRRGVRYPQWFLLLVAVLGILQGLLEVCLSVPFLESMRKLQERFLSCPRPKSLADGSLKELQSLAAIQ